MITGPGEDALCQHLDLLLNTKLALPLPSILDELPYPALDLAPGLTFIPLLISRGCPFSCDYCASRLLAPRYQRRSPHAVVEEILYWRQQLHLSEVAFYDDALLVDAENHLLIILEELARRGAGFRFHTPNGLHARFISPEVARWLKRANFATLRLGVETAAPGGHRLDQKLQEGELEAALRYLQEAGFSREELGVYLLLGLPNQEDAEVAASIRQVRELGATPVLALYSPIPGTTLWPEALAASPYDLENEPLYHNNSLFPCWPTFSWERYTHLKRLAQGLEL
ncbi:MAG: radical SAM protein [Syntrophobacterales bacterium]